MLHYAPPCTKLCTIGPRPQPGHPEYEAAASLVCFSVDGIERRAKKGAEGSMESPYAANTWRIGRVIEFFGTREKPAAGKVFVSPDLCQYDMK